MVTVNAPVTELAPKLTCSCVGESTTNPPNTVAPSFTLELSARFVPVKLSVSPAWAGLGAAELSFGKGLKSVGLSANPAAVVTRIRPTPAVPGTLATIAVAVFETTSAG